MQKNKKKNILHITFDMRIGGTEQVIRNIIESTNTERFNTSILCLESPLGPFGELLRSQGVRIISLSRSPGIDVSLLKEIRKVVKEQSIDIVHCHQYTPWFYGAIAMMFSGVKIIFTEHGRFYPDSTTWKRKIINPFLLLNTHAVTAISKATKDALTEFEFIKPNDIEVIYNGIVGLEPRECSSALRSSLGCSDSTLLLGTVARLDPIKNHVMMLRAFSQVLNSGTDAHLVIVGDGDERETIEKTISSLSLEGNVTLTGYITNPTSYLEAFDVYLLSSLSEGTSMTLLEAMSLGRPCVVTDAGGNPEIIKHKYNGLVTPNDDANEFAHAIMALANSQQTRDDMGLAAKKRFEELFSARSMTKHFEALYETLMNNIRT